jgi:putative lipoprotein
MKCQRSALAIAALACLAGCPQETPPPTPMDAPIPTESNVIHGRADYLERIKIPPGADFTVQLIDNQLADTPNAVIATTTLEDVAGPPYDFALQYDPAKIRADGQYGLNATLRGADGGLLFVTDTRVPVTIGDAKVVEFRMKRVSTGDAPQPAAQLNRTQWTCGGMTFDAVFDLTNERVELALPEGTMSLPLAVSASGAKYGDHLGNAFWTKGSTGTFTRAGGKKVDCVQADAKPASGSVWEQAKARGVAFRAIGNEPGWFVEVGPGETPMLHAELDYGEHKLDAKVQMLSGLLGYATTQGTPMRLVLERRACSDGMSDATYPVDATFDVGGKRYRGCGRFLD